MNGRIEHIRERMREDGLDAVIVSDPTSIFYLTGASIQPFERMWLLLVKADGEDVLFANRLFVFGETGLNVDWHSDTDDAPARLCSFLGGVKRLGVDKVFPARFLLPAISSGETRACLYDVTDGMRIVKDERELDLMRKSSRINDEACAAALASLREGMTEKELAAIVAAEYEKRGASGCCFDTIAAFGANGADPHHETGNARLKKGDSVLLDMGCYYQGYCSDMTRTAFFGSVTDRQREVYAVVKEAADRAKALVRPGVRFCDIDAAARDHIAACGYGEYFTHRLGHCIGLADHEPEDVGPVNTHPVREGMVFSIEPGIYLPGEFGVRLEDLVTVTADGCEVLNRLSQELTVLQPQ